MFKRDYISTQLVKGDGLLKGFFFCFKIYFLVVFYQCSQFLILKNNGNHSFKHLPRSMFECTTNMPIHDYNINVHISATQ